jgi:hypothetical protein
VLKKNREKRKGLSGGKKFGPPPKRGPNPQGKDYSIPSVSVEMTDKDVIDRIYEFFNTGSVVYIKPRQDHHLDSWRWRARGKSAVNIYFKIYNYLSARRKTKIDQVLKKYCEDANDREKYKKLEGVLKNVVKRD